MFRDKENKWTRERSFWELQGGNFLMLGVAVFFLVLSAAGFAMILLQPRIAGLHELFSDPAPLPPPEQKLHLAPGEQEILLIRKPVPATPQEPKK